MQSKYIVGDRVRYSGLPNVIDEVVEVLPDKYRVKCIAHDKCSDQIGSVFTSTLDTMDNVLKITPLEQLL